MRKGEKRSLLQRGRHLLQVLLVVLMTGSLIFSSCAGCNGGGGNEGLNNPSQGSQTTCESVLKNSTETGTVSADDFNNIISLCYSKQSDSKVASAIQQYPVVYNYTVLLYDVKKFVEEGLNGLGQLLNMLNTSPAAFKTEATVTGDLTALLKSMLFSKLLPYMEDGNQRVATLAKMNMDDVSVYYESIPVDLNLSNFIDSNNVGENIPQQIDLKGEWDYFEVLAIGAINNGIFAAWKLIESQTLGTLNDILGIYNKYSIDMNLDNPFYLTNLIASIAGNVPAILAFEPTEGKEIFRDAVRLYLDGALSYLTGRDNDLENNGTVYAVKNPGLFAAIENMYSKDQSKCFIQFVDKDGDGQISYKDQIVVPLLEEIKEGLGTYTSPIKRQTWLDLIAFGKQIETQLENYESATANLDAGKMLNEVFDDLVAYASEVSPDVQINIPDIPEGFLMINAGALFKAAANEDSFKGLRSLFPAWVPNPRKDDTASVDGRLDVDKEGTPFDYLLVFETEVSASTKYQAAGPLTDGQTLYYGLYEPQEDPVHFSLFFDAQGNPNATFFGDVDPSAGDGAADLTNLHQITADGLLPNDDHNTLVYFGFQQPTFYGLISINPAGFGQITGCNTDALKNSDDPQLLVNGVINCAILQFGTPVGQLFDVLAGSLVNTSL